MIISKTPLRVSLFGGGTDYPEYFNKKRGSVLGGTINKYIYSSISSLAPIATENFRLQYRIVESCDYVSQIKHPVIREILKMHDDLIKINIATVSDLPGGSGLGSSSAFTVGLLAAIHSLKKQNVSPLELANSAILIERDKLLEKVGVQDQFHASFGGFSNYEFYQSKNRITRINTALPTFKTLNKSVFMVYTGGLRKASQVTLEQVKKTERSGNDVALQLMLDFVDEAKELFEAQNRDNIIELAKLLNESWKYKKSLSNQISTPEIDELIKFGLRNGALGAKLLGAGGNGFILFIARKSHHKTLQDMFGQERCIAFNFVNTGVQIVYPNHV